jgi:hypothetical protein
METSLKIVAVALMTGVALIGLSSCQRQQESALKPIDKAAVQTMVDTTARELLIPGSKSIERKPLMMRARLKVYQRLSVLF